MSGLEASQLGRGLSIEMKQKNQVKNIVVSEKDQDQVLFEANLGQLIELSLIDFKVLEIKGDYGIIRVDLDLEELEKLIKDIRSRDASGSKLESHTRTNILRKENRKGDVKK